MVINPGLKTKGGPGESQLDGWKAGGERRKVGN